MNIIATSSATAGDGPGPRALVVGASFAGLATAYWLDQLGYRVSVIEIADGLRRGGTPVDIKEGTVDVMRRMGLLEAVRARSLPPRRTEFRDADDVTHAVFPARPIVFDSPDEAYEIDRDELLDILFGAVRDRVEITFGRSVHRFDEGPDAVATQFADGSGGTFDLVFGCDGMRSATRRRVFGCDDGWMHDLNLYAFLKVVPRRLIARDTTQIHSVPGRTVMLNGYENKTDIGLAFHVDGRLDYDHRDLAEQRRLVRERFAGLGWRTADLLREVEAEGDFYFDRICQIRMPRWSKGRVALVGDAGYCPSPLAGMGGSMAIVGAAALADALRGCGGDHAAAFRAYEDGLRPFVSRVQEEAATTGRTLFMPATADDVAERDRMLAAMG